MRAVLAMAIVLVLGFASAYSWISWQHAYSHHRQYLSSLAALSGKSVDTYFFSLESALRTLGETVLDEDAYREPGSAAQNLRIFASLKMSYPPSISSDPSPVRTTL